MAEFFDVAIVGGGPAGSTAGTLLAKHGWNVAIFEKEKFPRFKIGESLLPGSLRTFERMGVKEKIDRADVIVFSLPFFPAKRRPIRSIGSYANQSGGLRNSYATSTKLAA